MNRVIIMLTLATQCVWPYYDCVSWNGEGTASTTSDVYWWLVKDSYTAKESMSTLCEHFDIVTIDARHTVYHFYGEDNNVTSTEWVTEGITDSMYHYSNNLVVVKEFYRKTPAFAEVLPYAWEWMYISGRVERRCTYTRDGRILCVMHADTKGSPVIGSRMDGVLIGAKKCPDGRIGNDNINCDD